MAVSLRNAGQVGRAEYITVGPEYVEKGRNSRAFDFGEDEILDMVESYERLNADGDPQGQQVPIECRKLKASGKLEVHAGRRRLEGALRYNLKHPDAPMKVKVIVVDCSDEEALARGIENNRRAKATSWVDDCFNQERLRKDHGWNDKKIAKFYGIQQSVVSRLKKLLPMRKRVLKLVHEGTISFDAACDLAELDDISQDEILAKIKTLHEENEAAEEKRRRDLVEDAAKMPQEPPGGSKTAPGSPVASKEPGAATAKPEAGAAKPPKGAKKPEVKKPTASQVVKKAVREKKLEQGAGAKKKERTLKEVKEFFAGFDGAGEDKNVKAFCGFVLDWIAGEMTDVRLTKYVSQYLLPYIEEDKK